MICEKHLPTKVEYEDAEGTKSCPMCDVQKQWLAFSSAALELGLIYLQGALVCPLAIQAPQQEPYRSIGQQVATGMSGVLAKLQKVLQGDKKIVPAGLRLV